MATPDMLLSAADKELLRLLSELLSGHSDLPVGNHPASAAVLSDADAGRLLELIEMYVSSPKFFKRSHLIEGVTADGGPTSSAREIYLSLRAERGRSRVMSSYHWSEFQVRLGIVRNVYRYSRTKPMSDQLFLRKERELLLSAGVNPRVADVAMDVIASAAPHLVDGSRQLRPLKARQIRDLVSAPFSQDNLASGAISTKKLVAAISLVADMSVLFTTRDWDVVGTLSSVAGLGMVLMLD